MNNERTFSLVSGIIAAILVLSLVAIAVQKTTSLMSEDAQPIARAAVSSEMKEKTQPGNTITKQTVTIIEPDVVKQLVEIE